MNGDSVNVDDPQRDLISRHNEKKILLAWPTFPVPFKGSDTRAIDAIVALTRQRCKVDLIIWKEFNEELKLHSIFAQGSIDYEKYDSKNEEIKKLGVHNIFGPYNSESPQFEALDVSEYYAFLYWIWPDRPYLEFLVMLVEYVSSINGRVHILAAVDDSGIAARWLVGNPVENPHGYGMTDVLSFLMQKRQHPDLLGVNHSHTKEHNTRPFQFPDPTYRANFFFHMEQYLYTMADLTLGINKEVVDYLSRVVPGTPSYPLRYKAPLNTFTKKPQHPLPFEQRSDYVFFGYDNEANQRLLEWFYKNVFPKVEGVFHIAGMITYNVPYFCTCSKGQEPCKSALRYSKHAVHCHGPIPESQLNELVGRSRVAINPALEPSGVATKSCHALALGTPVVASNLDGTFLLNDDHNDDDGMGALICNLKSPECFVDGINLLLTDSMRWSKLSKEGPLFLSRSFGRELYDEDWMQILKVLEDDHHKVNIIIQGNAIQEGDSMVSQNWHIAHTLSYVDGYNITVVGKLDPRISGVSSVNAPSHKNVYVGESAGLLARGHYIYPPSFNTGYQADIVIRQQWPPSFDTAPLSYCGPGCRVVHILPWEFGFLPVKWMDGLKENIDWLWAPSEYNRKIYEQSGYDPLRTAVASAGIDCSALTSKNQTVEQPKFKVGNDDAVTFLYSGGYIPRKGIDIVLESWEYLFCNHDVAHNHSQHVRLIIHTTYELGYSDSEMYRMEQIIKRCGNVEWLRNQNLSKEDHRSLLFSADIYLAPFRSEGVGLSVVETLALGLSVIVSVGESAADDWVIKAMQVLEENGIYDKIYPVQAEATVCHHAPCDQQNLCIFSPCRPVSKKKREFRCACEKLTDTPFWFEVNRADFRLQMTQALDDILIEKKRLDPFTNKNRNDDSWRKVVQKFPFCWQNLQVDYVEKINHVLQSTRKRSVQPFIFYNPRDQYRYDAKINAIKWFICIAGFLCAAYAKNSHSFPSYIKRKKSKRQAKLQHKLK